MYYCLNVCFQECKFTKQELHKLRRENGSLDSERHEHSKTLSQLQTRVAVLEQELRDKEQVATVYSLGQEFNRRHVYLNESFDLVNKKINN